MKLHHQAARDEVHVAVAQATEMSRAEHVDKNGCYLKIMQRTMGPLIKLLNEMHGVAGLRTGKRENKFAQCCNGRTSKASEAKLRASGRMSAVWFDATCEKFNKKSKSNRLRAEKKLKL